MKPKRAIKRGLGRVLWAIKRTRCCDSIQTISRDYKWVCKMCGKACRSPQWVKVKERKGKP